MQIQLIWLIHLSLSTAAQDALAAPIPSAVLEGASSVRRPHQQRLPARPVPRPGAGGSAAPADPGPDFLSGFGRETRVGRRS